MYLEFVFLFIFRLLDFIGGGNLCKLRIILIVSSTRTFLNIYIYVYIFPLLIDDGADPICYILYNYFWYVNVLYILQYYTKNMLTLILSKFKKLLFHVNITLFSKKHDPKRNLLRFSYNKAKEFEICIEAQPKNINAFFIT